MEWLHPLVLWVITAIALIYFGLGLFNVEWHLRVRILVALGAGALLIAGIGYPLVRPADPLGAISMFTKEISTIDVVILAGLGFLAGVVATLACYPLGSALGPFAAPAGIAVLALSCGSMRALLLYNQDFAARSELYAFLRWELLFWVAVCAAGYVGSIITGRLLKTKTVIEEDTAKNDKTMLINGLIGMVITGVVVYFTLGIFAQDIRQIDEKLGSVSGLPGNGQIAFGVFVSVGLAAFLLKYIFNISYLWSILGSLLLYFVMYTRIPGSAQLEHLSATWPIYFLSHAIYGIIPLQFTSFAFLGALTGFWIAIRLQQKTEEEAK